MRMGARQTALPASLDPVANGMMLQLQEEIVRGPETHPEFGRVLVIRPGVSTARQNRLPSQAIVVTAVARKLIEIAREGGKLQALVVEKGDYDPTAHPEFHHISENLRELMSKHFPRAKMVLVSESPDLERAQARHAVTLYDTPILRLDAGTQRTYAALTGDAPGVFKTRVASMARLETERLVVEAQFQQAPVDNTGDVELRHWLKHLTAIRPSRVRICTPRRSANGTKGTKRPKPANKTRMGEIAELITEKIGVPVEVLAG